jgi:SARP family transcriptional regulator, regulator of embCAB operon
MTVDIKVLGPLEATACGASIVPSARKQRQVLALLALNPGHVVTSDTLIEEIWDDRPPGVPLGTLQTYILHLRRHLGQALGQDDGAVSSKDVLITSPGGYALDVPADAVDAVRYERLLAAGRRAVNSGDYPAAARQLGEALDVWRGRALIDVSIGPVLQVERTRLEESRLCTLDLRIDADLRLGRHRLLLDELAALCVRHPWFENFHAQYMLALHRSGLQWRALEVYRRLYASAGKQLGIDPSRHLRQLHQAILADDPTVNDPTFVVSDLWTRQGV